MDLQDIIQQLQILAKKDDTRSSSAKLNDIFDYVEHALAAGVPRTSILNKLETYGLKIKMKNFETILTRLRKKRIKVSNLTESKTLMESREKKIYSGSEITQTDANNINTNLDTISHDPADLNKIFNNKPDLEALAKLVKRKKS